MVMIRIGDYNHPHDGDNNYYWGYNSWCRKLDQHGDHQPSRPCLSILDPPAHRMFSWALGMLFQRSSRNTKTKQMPTEVYPETWILYCIITNTGNLSLAKHANWMNI